MSTLIKLFHLFLLATSARVQNSRWRSTLRDTTSRGHVSAAFHRLPTSTTRPTSHPNPPNSTPQTPSPRPSPRTTPPPSTTRRRPSRARRSCCSASLSSSIRSSPTSTVAIGRAYALNRPRYALVAVILLSYMYAFCRGAYCHGAFRRGACYQHGRWCLLRGLF